MDCTKLGKIPEDKKNFGNLPQYEFGQWQRLDKIRSRDR
jgi:hypothetical protein